MCGVTCKYFARKLSLEHRKMVEINRRKVEADKSQEQEVAMRAKRAIEADTIEFHSYAEVGLATPSCNYQPSCNIYC